MTSLINTIDQTINFNEQTIRIVGTYDKPMFVAYDICKILGLTNVTDTLRSLPEKWKQIQTINMFEYDLENKTSEKDRSYVRRKQQEMNCITEAGLYKIIMRSNKPIAQKFQEVVCEDILPSIRKTGEFKLQQILEDKERTLQIKEEEKNLLEEKLIENNNLLKKETLIRKNLKAKYECFLDRRIDINNKFDKGECVYILGFEEIPNKLKIGFTTDLKKRISDFYTESPFEPVVYYKRYVSNAKFIESVMHHVLRKFRIHNAKEWFQTDNKQIFIDDLDDVIVFFENKDKKYESIIDVKGYLLDEIKNDTIEDTVEDIIEDTFEDTVEDIVEDTETKKTCYRCKNSLPLNNFAKSPTKDGHDYICKKCKNEKYIETKNAKKIELTQKECSKCKFVKDINDFYKRVGSIDGKTSECKDCTVGMYSNRVNKRQNTKVIDIKNKTCANCKKILDISNFGNKTDSADGHMPWCKNCCSEHAKKERLKPKTLLSEVKTCNSCNKELNISNFWNSKTNKDGKDNKCKSCHKEIRNKKK